ncbi:hypothetical protein ACGFMM_08645 [Streptomyces sp. NPDC048604]|uniref:hypothetical protein n=1 Tax=Streptomyces sp. NPDC048604 TaxID=3365578 RepID=UPI003722EF84
MRAAAMFVLSAGVAAPALVTAPAAYAETATVTRTTTLDDGRLDIGLPSNALWVKVNVLASTAPDAAVLASTDELRPHEYDYSTGQPAGWKTDAALRLPEGTALGDYPVSVDYRLPGGTVQHWTGGTFAYKLHTGVAETVFDRTTTDWDHRQVVLSGKATTFDPSTGTSGPARAGTKVKVTLDLDGGPNPSAQATAVTGNGGTFSVPFTPNARVESGTATVVEPAADTDPDATHKVRETVGVEQTKYRINATLDKFRVPLGQNVNVKGRVERLTNDGWQPFAGAPVVSSRDWPYAWVHHVARPMGGADAAADGTFAYPASAPVATDVFTHVRPSVYLGELPFARGSIAVPQRAAFSDVKIAIDPFGTVRATGKLNAVGCESEPVAIQYSLDGRTWRSLKWGRSSYTGTAACPFDISVNGYVRAYYRVVHAETDRYITAVSAPVFQTRTLTRFSSFTISPTRPTVNGTMTVSGAVQKQVSGVWKPAGGQYLTLYFKPRGESQWYWVKKNVKTAANGGFKFTATNYGDGYWGMATQPLTGYFYSESKAVYIDAR